MKFIQLLRRMSPFLVLMALIFFVGCENPTSSDPDPDPSPDDDVPSGETPSDADSTSVEITGLDEAYDGFEGILFAFEAGYEFAADALTVASQSLAEASETAGGSMVKVSENGFGPVFLESESVDESTDEDIWVDFVGKVGTDYDLYFVVEEDWDSIGETVTVIHGGTGEDLQPLYTFSGGSALEITIDAADAGVTEYSVFAGATFNITGVSIEYQDWDVSVAIFEEGVEPADGAEVAGAVDVFGEDGTIGATGSAGPLYAFDANNNSRWAGDAGQEYDVYLFLENDGDDGYESAFVFGPDYTPLKVLSGGSEQTIDVSVPDNAVYFEEVSGGQVVDGALIVRGRLSEIDFPDGYVVPTEPIFNLRIDKPTSNDPDDDNVAVNDTDGGDDFRMEYSETPPDLQNIDDWLDEPELTISNTDATVTDAIVRLYDEPNDDLQSIDYITRDPEDDTLYYQFYIYVSEATSITGELTDEEDGLVETWDLSLVAGWNVVIASENDTSNKTTIGTTVPDGLEGAWFAD